MVNKTTATLQKGKTPPKWVAQSAEAIYNTTTASLQRVKTHHYECPDVIKPSDGEAPALQIWGMQSKLSLPLLPGQVWLEIAPDRILWANKWLMVDWITWSFICA